MKYWTFAALPLALIFQPVFDSSWDERREEASSLLSFLSFFSLFFFVMNGKSRFSLPSTSFSSLDACRSPPLVSLSVSLLSFLMTSCWRRDNFSRIKERHEDRSKQEHHSIRGNKREKRQNTTRPRITKKRRERDNKRKRKTKCGRKTKTGRSPGQDSNRVSLDQDPPEELYSCQSSKVQWRERERKRERESQGNRTWGRKFVEYRLQWWREMKQEAKENLACISSQYLRFLLELL